MQLADQDKGRLLVLAAAALIAAASVTAYLASARDDVSDDFAARGVGAPNPEPGKEVPIEEVEELIRQNEGPLLPQQGKFPADSVSRAWVDDYGSFGFQFHSGLSVIFSLESRSHQEAQTAFREMVEADIADYGFSPFTVEGIRATVGLAHEAASDGPASLGWREGGLLIQIIGYGGESLSELRELASSMSATATTE